MNKRTPFLAALLIAARPAAGFRRCGLHHPPEQVRHAPGTFSHDEVRALTAEPNLIVVEAELTDEELAAQDGGAKKTDGEAGDPKKRGAGKTPPPAS